jgi:putative membrane protein
MGVILSFLITAVVVAVSLLIISYIPFLGVEVDSPGKALTAGAIFGLLNAFLAPILKFLAVPFNFITFGLLAFIVAFLINVIIFGLTAKLVEGFRLRNGFVSAILGALALAVVNSILFSILGNLGLFSVRA